MLKVIAHFILSRKDALGWISYQTAPGVPSKLHKDFFLRVDAVIGSIADHAENAGDRMRAMLAR